MKAWVLAAARDQLLAWHEVRPQSLSGSMGDSWLWEVPTPLWQCSAMAHLWERASLTEGLADERAPVTTNRSLQ